MNQRLLVLPSIFAVAIACGATLSPVEASAPEASGETLFRQRCQACHSATPGQRSPLGPNLAGVIGRKAGSQRFNYSAALSASGLTWDRTTVDRFLTSPTKTIPGTRMTVTVPNPAQRAALITYLASRE